MKSFNHHEKKITLAIVIICFTNVLFAQCVGINSDGSAFTGKVKQNYSTGATVSSFLATGSSIRWYAYASGETALISSSVLANGAHYVATPIDICTESATNLEVTVTKLICD